MDVPDPTTFPAEEPTPPEELDPFLLSKDDVAAWQDRIKRAYDQWVSPYETWWDEAKKCYAPEVTETPGEYGETIRTNRAFTIVSRKEADLFYQRPDVTVQPAPFLEAMPGGFALAATHGQILNEKL